MSGRLSTHPIFGLGSENARRDLLAGARTLELDADERVLTEGDTAEHVYALERGAARVFLQSPTGDEVACKLFRAPAVFGEAEAFYGVPFQENVETIEPSCVIAIPMPVLRAFLLAAPEAGVAFVEDLSARLAISIYHQRSLAFNPVTIRLANFLLDYAEWVQADGADQWRIALSQDEMAASVGATRRSIGKDISTWQREGIVERRGHVYVVRDPVALERFADPDRLRLVYRLAGMAPPADGVERPQRAPAGPPRRRDK